MLDRLAGLESEYEAVLEQLADPAVVADRSRLRDVSRRHKELEGIVRAYRDYRQATEDLAAAKEMFAEASGEDREVMRDEAEKA